MAEREVMKLSLEQIAEWTGSSQLAMPRRATAVPTAQATGYSIDTRTLARGRSFLRHPR